MQWTFNDSPKVRFTYSFVVEVYLFLIRCIDIFIWACINTFNNNKPEKHGRFNYMHFTDLLLLERIRVTSNNIEMLKSNS